MTNCLIHPTAIVSVNAVLGQNVEVGPYTIIHDDVVLRDNVKIGAYCELGIKTPLAKEDKLEIGANSVIRSHATIYAGSCIGDSLVTGHYVTIRENSIIGLSCQIGNRSDIQGDCTIGNYTKMHADVHIGKCSKIGDFVWLFPEVLLTNDPMPPSNELVGVVIKDYAVLAAKVLVLPGVVIGNDSVIAAGSLVKESISDGKLAVGNPAKIMCDAKMLRSVSNPKLKGYPWRYRFQRGYPAHIIEQWLNEINEQQKIK
jgi:acetyltransferase-like isoleucine patch superfamily enzyme